MFFPRTDFWSHQEQANAFVHMWFGLGMSLILWGLGFGSFSLLGGFIGLAETLRQIAVKLYKKKEFEDDFVKDKIRDNICYWIGAFSLIPVINIVVKGLVE